MTNRRWFAGAVAPALCLVLGLWAQGVHATEWPRGSTPQPIGFVDQVTDLQLWNSFVGGAGFAGGPDELGLGGSSGQPLSGEPDLEADLWVCSGFWAPGADDASDPDPIDDDDFNAIAGEFEEGMDSAQAGGGPPVEHEPVTSFSLAPVLPNPSRGLSYISWTVPHESNVRVTIHDLQGRMATVIADGPHPVGRYRIQWNARASSATASPGVYFVRLETAAGIFTRRVALIQ